MGELSISVLAIRDAMWDLEAQYGPGQPDPFGDNAEILARNLAQMQAAIDLLTLAEAVGGDSDTRYAAEDYQRETLAAAD